MDDEIKDCSIAHAKPMLSVEEQIQHLESKGIRFKECSKQTALEYLSKKNNFYKVVSYRKLFDIRCGGIHDGEYANLDFAYLKDLSAIDQQLRYTLLPMTLDIEHFAKVKLLSIVTEFTGEDGYSIVDDYLMSLSSKERSRRNRELSIMSKDPYCGEMVKKYRRDMPVWVFVEAVSFGAFISFYRFCALRWENTEMKDEHYLLRQSKSIRNASAHSSNLISEFAEKNATFKNYKAVSEALSSIGISTSQRKTKMNNAAIQQIVSTLYVYERLVEGETSTKRALSLLKALGKRMDRQAAYYKNNDAIRSSFAFLKKIIDSWF